MWPPRLSLAAADGTQAKQDAALLPAHSSLLLGQRSLPFADRKINNTDHTSLAKAVDRVC